MKRLLVLAVVIVSVLCINSCCKTNTPPPVPTEITFDVPFTDTGAFKDSIKNTFGVPIPITYVFKAATGVAQGLAANNMKKENVTSAKGEYLKILIENPPTQYFDFADSLRIYFATVTDSANKTLVATKFVIPPTSQNLVMDMIDVELKNFLLQDSLYMFVKGYVKNNGEIKAGTQLRFNANFKVKGHL